ncbi:hypothetical protein BLOT_005214 [Blomia tropicalis]|nr:hypothetical protein BLOT_005214 [Blomia tropicalis]
MKRFRKKKKNDNTTDKMEIAKHTYNYRLQSFIDVERFVSIQLYSHFNLHIEVKRLILKS